MWRLMLTSAAPVLFLGGALLTGKLVDLPNEWKTPALLVSWSAALLLSLGLGWKLHGWIDACARMMHRMRRQELDIRMPAEGPRAMRRLELELNKLARQFRRVHAELEGTSRQLSGLLDGMREGVLVTDRAGTILLANQALREIFREGGKVIGSTVLELYRSPELSNAIQECCEHNSSFRLELVLKLPETRYVIARVAPWKDQGVVAGVVCVLEDTTKTHKLEQVRKDFVANASHELRTPVAAIRGYAELLQEDERLPADAQEYASVIERNSRRLSALIDDILALARIESPSYQPQLVPVEVRTITRQVLQSLEGLAKDRRVTLALMADEQPLWVLAEPRGLEHVLSNLVDNGLKYTPPGGSVTVQLVQDGERIQLLVVDTGVGIPAVDLDRVFERFYRVDSARSRAVGGTGLGLAIVKHLVQALHGDIRVDSVYGSGSTFTVTLPKVEDPSRSARGLVSGLEPSDASA